MGWILRVRRGECFSVEVGDDSRALDLLEQLMAIPAGDIVSPAMLKLDPGWDALRKEPRFNALLIKSPPTS